MKIFVIHRFKDRRIAKNKLKQLAKKYSLKLNLIFLNSCGGEQWKQKALKAIEQAEAVIVVNRESCEESPNANWEINKAKEARKEIIDFNLDAEDSVFIERLKSLYHLTEEFEACFSSDDKKDFFDLYKLMIESSESLIQRRQKTNAFFITVIGSLLTIAGLLVKTGAINSSSFSILYMFSVAGLLLCNSWRNLIDNYGKLNKAKFDVILRLEKEL